MCTAVPICQLVRDRMMLMYEQRRVELYLLDELYKYFGVLSSLSKAKPSSHKPQDWCFLNLEVCHSPDVLGSVPKYTLAMLVFLYLLSFHCQLL